MVYIYFFDDDYQAKNPGIPTFNMVEGYGFEYLNISIDQAKDILNNLEFESHVRLISVAEDLSKIFDTRIICSTKAIPVKTDDELVANQYLEVRLDHSYDKDIDPIDNKYTYYITHYPDSNGNSDVSPYIH